MKIYVSGPVTGVKGYLARFRDCIRKIESRFPDNDVINPALVCYPLPDSTSHDEYMEICLRLLGMCDTIVMMDGWRGSTGACIEYGYAMARELNVLYEKDLED